MCKKWDPNWQDVDPRDWMGYIDDATPLAEITLAGAHDCATNDCINFHQIIDIINLFDNVVCQKSSIPELLDSGVRYLDLRLSHTDRDKLVCVHGKGIMQYYCYIPQDSDTDAISVCTFDWVQTQCLAFLDAHPSETIVVCIKDEDNGEHGEEFKKLLHDQIMAQDSRWYRESKLPLLQQARGKLVLLRRYAVNGEEEEKNWGVDLTTWDKDRDRASKSAKQHTTARRNACYPIGNDPLPRALVQDEYLFINVCPAKIANKKWETCILGAMNCFHELLGVRKIPCINMTSCTNLVSVGKLANCINLKLISYIESMEADPGSYGWFVGDYVDDAYCKTVYSMNKYTPKA